MSATCTRTAKPAGVRDGSAPMPPGVKARLASVARRFARDQSGAVAMIFGLMLIPMAAMIGLAVDFGRVYAVNSSTQVALDSAALAAGRVAQVEPSDTINKASAAATAYFNQTKPKNVVSSTLQFSPNSAETAFTVTATSWVRTPFLGALDFIIKKEAQSGAPTVCQGSYFNCVKMTTTSTAELKAGGDGGSNVEVAMMLDVTGSMCSPCTKIDAAKAAAKDLVDIVIWSDQSQYTSRIALAPFAEAVNVGTTLAPLVRGTVTNNTQTTPQTLNVNQSSSQPTSKWIKYANVSSGNNTWQISTKCVTERIGNDKYTDTAPSSTSTYVGKGYFGTNADTSCGVGSSSDTEVNSIYPLTDDKETLKRRIDKLDDRRLHGGPSRHGLGVVSAVAQVELRPQPGLPERKAGRSLQRPDDQERQGCAEAAQDRGADDGRRLQHQLLQGRGGQEFGSEPGHQLQLGERQVAGSGHQPVLGGEGAARLEQ